MVESRSNPVRLLAAGLAAVVAFSTSTANANAADPAPENAEESLASLDAPDPTDAVTGPRVRLEVRGRRRLSLYGVDQEFAGVGSGAGGTVAVHGIAYRRLCIAPCDQTVRSGTGTFFVGGEPYTASRPFDLPASGDVVVEARPGHKALLYTGWFSLMFGIPMLIAGATLAGLSRASGMPIGSKGLHGALIGVGAGLVVVSVPLFIFGRTRAKVR